MLQRFSEVTVQLGMAILTVIIEIWYSARINRRFYLIKKSEFL